MTVTYEDVAATLPRDIREAIELSLPCAGGPQHLWNEEHYDYVAKRPDLWWQCVYCSIATRTRQIPPVNRPWAIITADEILRGTR